MSEISRRAFLEGTSAGLAAAALPSREATPARTAPAAPPTAAPRTLVRIVVNGVERRLDTERRRCARALLDRPGASAGGAYPGAADVSD